MYIKKVYKTKDTECEWGIILFPTLEIAMNIGCFEAKELKMVAAIFCEDGEAIWDGSPKDVLRVYEKLLEVEPNELSDLPRSDDEVYVYDNNDEEMIVMKKSELENYFKIIKLFD